VALLCGVAVRTSFYPYIDAADDAREIRRTVHLVEARTAIKRLHGRAQSREVSGELPHRLRAAAGRCFECRAAASPNRPFVRRAAFLSVDAGSADLPVVRCIRSISAAPAKAYPRSTLPESVTALRQEVTNSGHVVSVRCRRSDGHGSLCAVSWQKSVRISEFPASPIGPFVNLMVDLS